MKFLSMPAVSALAVALAGCAVFGGGKGSALQNNPDYRQGYEDGCAAATDQGADLRDRQVGDGDLYKSDDVYRAGWRSGFQTCRRTDLQPGAQPGDNPVSVPGPGAH